MAFWLLDVFKTFAESKLLEDLNLLLFDVSTIKVSTCISLFSFESLSALVKLSFLLDFDSLFINLYKLKVEESNPRIEINIGFKL